VQNAIGQTDGGHAGVFWSGFTNEDGVEDIPPWKVQMYVEYEIECYFQEDK
jgi:hypothetical protein